MAKSNTEYAILIRQDRQRRGMSEGELAQAPRLSRTYIYHLEAGIRSNPSPHVAESIPRALELHHEEKRSFYTAYTAFTGQYLHNEQSESALLDMGELAKLVVYNTSYPAQSLDRLWF